MTKTKKRMHPHSPLLTSVVAAASFLACASPTFAFTTAQVGIDQLRAFDPTLTGTGVVVVQVEATTYINPNDPNNTLPYDPQFDSNDFEVNPTSSISLTPTGLPITYINGVGDTDTSFPNSVGINSDHANHVAQIFYGTDGSAPGIAAVYNYNANYYVPNVILTNTPVPAKIVNQSFTDQQDTTSDEQALDQLYDNYVVNYGTIICTAAGNGGAIQDPGTAYDVITVGAFDNGLQGTSTGPTSDGRSKPDIAAPADATSFSTPWVSGIAAIMVQAGTNGVGGNAAASVDPTMVKALLLNGAVKQTGWSHTTTQPLDTTTGAGIVNAYNSYENLAGGSAQASSTSQLLVGFPHPGPLPLSVTTFQHHQGWNLGTITSSDTTDAVDHYYFNISAPASSYAFTSTLTWARPAGAVTTTTDPDGNPETDVDVMDINHLDLYLFDIDTQTFVDSSISTVDNVQQLYDPTLAPGHYDLQVLKHGGANTVSDSQVYALAWRMLAVPGTMPGDANFDGVVDIQDLTAVANNWQRVGTDWTEGDFNGDGVVDIQDLTAIANHWQEGVTSGGGSGDQLALMPSFSSLLSTPEPNTLGVVMIGALTGLLRGRKRHPKG